ncbi:hypothetical protein EIP86_006188 [Pleurotus ostreatoroseus]|nr:hypothetical protein EIP86_006188 [Pleurotus ostreatoroseus]
MAKRKQTPQSSTLHDFFSKPGPSSVCKKPRLSSEHLSSSSKKPRARKPVFNVAPEDIIVIEDDDEEPSSRYSQEHDASSDIEIIEGPLTPTARNSSNKGSASLKSRHEQEGDSKDALDMPTPIKLDEEDLLGTQILLLEQTYTLKVEKQENDDFGFPSLLLPSGPPQHHPSDGDGPSNLPRNASTLDAAQSPPIPAAGPTAFGFDVCPSPAVLATPSESAPQTPAVPHPDDGPAARPPARKVPDDEWGMGDDEVADGADAAADAIMLDEADIEDADAVEYELALQSQIADGQDAIADAEACPICGIFMHAMATTEMQQHVNACIDAMNVDAPSTSKLRHASRPPPLSPIQTPSPPSPIRPSPDIKAVSADDAPKIKSNTNGKGKGKSRDPGAFSVLMTSYKENEAWKEATVAEDRNFRPTKANGGRRKAPFYKVLQGMPIAVDAFRYGSIPGVTAYFLTHAHSDHYTNLSANWKSGPIYCSQGTANLIMHMLGVHSKWVHPLPMNVATEIPDTGGVRVTLIEANHCPGSSLFLFEGKQTVNAGDSAYKSAYVGSSKVFRYLHCGDFRASPQHVLHPAIKGKRIDHVYLDTTYLDPKYCFPPQSQVISACAELARRIVSGESLQGDAGSKDKKEGRVDGWLKVLGKSKESVQSQTKTGKTLVVVGTYSIGKERIVKAIAKALKTKVYSDPRKTAILRCESDPELDALLTSDPLEAGVHLLPLGTIASDRLKLYMERYTGKFDKVVGFRPTGWTFTAPAGTETLPSISSVISRAQSRTFTHANLSPMKNSTASLLLYGVPYSEHSSFFELTCFALSLDWVRMIATVNVGSESSRGKMSKWVERWEAERKKRGGARVVDYRAPDYW